MKLTPSPLNKANFPRETNNFSLPSSPLPRCDPLVTTPHRADCITHSELTDFLCKIAQLMLSVVQLGHRLLLTGSHERYQYCHQN